MTRRPKFHPLCLLFPRLGDEELQELAEDIRQNGLLNDIITLDGKVLDGRNRFEACRLAGVEPRYKEFDGDDPIGWVVAQNLLRRHLTASQRAVVAFSLLPILEADAKQRQRLSRGRGKKGRRHFTTSSSNGRASDVAASIAKTNAAYVHAVKAIEKRAPELIEEIRAGRLTVPEASDLAKLPKQARSSVLRQAERSDGNGKLTRVIRQAELDYRHRSAQRAARNGKPKTRYGKVEIWCGDCVALMKDRIKAKSVDVVVTSPPYNLAAPYTKYDDNRPEEEYHEWLGEVFAAIHRVLKDSGSFFLNVGSTRQRPLNAMQVAEIAGQVFELQNEIVWVKAISVDGRSYGHHTPLAGDRFLNHCFESVFHFTKDGRVRLDRLAVGVPYEYESNLHRNKAKSDLRCAGDVWFIPYETTRNRGSKGFHPSVFPTELPERCIRLHGVKRNMLVLDPLCGTGASLVAAARLGVAGIGIDLDPAYCREATKRVKGET
jgi:site-specific DNA-methyltransferase (adenine-specific)